MKQKRRFEYCEIGPMPAINLEILALLNAGHTMATTGYRVRLMCCGAEKEVTHLFVRWRQKDAEDRETPILCDACIRKIAGEIAKTRRKPRLIKPGEPWQVPPMALRIAREEGTLPR